MQAINVQKNTSSKFSFPPLPAHIISPEEPVDVRVSIFVFFLVCTIKSVAELSCGSLKWLIKGIIFFNFIILNYLVVFLELNLHFMREMAKHAKRA